MASSGAAHLSELFPAPSPPPSQFSPQRLPGANLESLAVLQDVLKDNHWRHHIYFNDMRFHNHTTHRALAIFAVGGAASVIRDYYERDARNQRPAIQSPEPITEENFVEHLGDEKFYQAYVSFFSEQVSEKGAKSTLEEFVFSEKYNFQKGRDASTQPIMLSRLFERLVHSLIHIGYGIEFGLKGMFVEGLALAAVENVNRNGSFPPSIFTLSSTNIADDVADRVSSFPKLDPLASATLTPAITTSGVHAFDIVARIWKDNRFSHRPSVDFVKQFTDIVAECFPIVWEHAEQWTINMNQPEELERKLEELVWLSSLVYGVGGLTSKGFQSDFFLMHMVTSSLFLPSLVAYLSPRSQVVLLRCYLSIVLMWWVIRGRPELNIRSFMATTAVEPSVPTTLAPGMVATTETTPTPNPFMPLLQSAMTHPVDHVVKIQRTFAHFSTLYGMRPAGYFKGTELEDAELLDGSLFLRASLLTADAVGWVREGQEQKQFSLQGFYA